VVVHLDGGHKAIAGAVSRLDHALGALLFLAVSLPAQPPTGTPITAHTTLAAGQQGRIGFETVTLSPAQFLEGVKEGPQSLIWGDLFLPPIVTWGEFHVHNEYLERRPAVILVHGEDGVGTQESQWAAMLHDMGVPTFILDRFTGRGFRRSFDTANTLSQEAMIVDVYRALPLLSTHPRIDPRRIALMGFSRGGAVALYASLMHFRGLHGPADREFAAHLVLYPLCNTTYVDEERVSQRPIRIFHGSADNLAPPTSCHTYVERLRAVGIDVYLTEYLSVHHQFDVLDLPAAQEVPDFPNRSRCVYVERSPGQLVNGATEQPFNLIDSCVRRGGTIGYDASAHGRIVEDIKAFLTATFTQNPGALSMTDTLRPSQPR
jgi:dienelactone hydrolase